MNTEETISLLKQLIATPSFSREEEHTAKIIAGILSQNGLEVFRQGNNAWAWASAPDPSKPALLLNSHHDTVRPSSGWTKDPFAPVIEDGKLFGLGSNDAGASLCAMMAAFLSFAKQDLPFNLLFAATAEEEISGAGGISSVLPLLGKFDAAIVGEPTQLKMAVAEKGLLVIDCTVRGKAGHAARKEGENAIYKALSSIEWFRDYRFPEISPWLGEVNMNVTVLEAGKQHNMVPDECRFTVDIRVTDAYTHEAILETIAQHVGAEIVPRSLRLRSSACANDHPLVRAGLACGTTLFGSPTLSDQALLPFPSVKIGPGDSARSHTSDEFIFLHEIEQGIELYQSLIRNLDFEAGSASSSAAESTLTNSY
jgi:acetylornithine deacetylase